MTKDRKISESLFDVLRDMNTLAVSLDKIGSAYSEMSEEEYSLAIRAFVEEWQVYKLVAHARSVLDEVAFDADEESKEPIENMEHWTRAKRLPSEKWMDRVDRRHSSKE